MNLVVAPFKYNVKIPRRIENKSCLNVTVKKSRTTDKIDLDVTARVTARSSEAECIMEQMHIETNPLLDDRSNIHRIVFEDPSQSPNSNEKHYYDQNGDIHDKEHYAAYRSWNKKNKDNKGWRKLVFPCKSVRSVVGFTNCAPPEDGLTQWVL